MMLGPSEVFADGRSTDGEVLVTGGGTGLGRAAAAELVRCGGGRPDRRRRSEVVERTAAGRSGRALVRGDIREQADAERHRAVALERFGRLDVLVNNAGGQYISPRRGDRAKGCGRSCAST